jgi:hypothetical protein
MSKRAFLQDSALADALSRLAERFREVRAAEHARRIGSVTFEPADCLAEAPGPVSL